MARGGGGRLQNVIVSKPYNSLKEIRPTYTECEVCERTIKTIDWQGHAQSKKHRENLQKVTEKEDEANIEDKAVANGDEAQSTEWGGGADTEWGAGADTFDSFGVETVNNNNKNNTSSDSCRKCGAVGHFARECPQAGNQSGKGCFNCGGDHLKRDCPNPPNGGGGRGRGPMSCYNCGGDHMKKDCPEAPASGGGGRPSMSCYKCGGDHMKKDCPEASGFGGGGGGRPFTCNNCNEEGHRASECPNPRKMICFNCNGEGHTKAECPLPRQPTDWSKVKCRNCGQMGHGPRRCPEPPKEQSSYNDIGGSGFDTGGFGFDTGSAATGGWDTAGTETTGDWANGDSEATGSWADDTAATNVPAW